jgi:putative MATE family efflux protein
LRKNAQKEFDPQDIAEKKRAMMLTAPVGRLVMKLSAPTVTIMLVSALYNMADTYFVGSQGTSATGAVGVSFSLMAVIQATGFFFGHGCGNFISRALGAKNTDDALAMAVTGCVTAFIMGGVITLLGTAFLTPMALLLGSTETILPYARDYMRFILLGAPFMVTSLMLNNLLRYQGSAVFGMIGMVTGAALNVALDPLLIFVFRMGVAGASLATAMSQTASCLLLFFVASRRGGNLPIVIRKFAPSGRMYFEMLKGGAPSLLRQGMNSVAMVILNRSARGYSDAVVAAIAIVNRVFLLASSAIIGFGQSFQPVCGFNYGARLYGRVKTAFRFCVVVATAVLTAVAAACMIFAPKIIAIFRPDDAEVIAVGTLALRAHSVTLPLLGWILMTSFLLQTMGKAVPASILAFARQGLFLIPFLWLAVPVLGVLGIQISIPVADLLTFALALPLGIHALKRGLDER